jgi:parallel beta-helix repeat protein
MIFMKRYYQTMLALAVACVLTISLPLVAAAQPFVHPGVDQSSKDLAYMKAKVLKGEEPYKSAFDRLKAATDTAFTVTPFTHVLRGPYGKPNIGGNDLSKCANMAYNYALLWYISNDKSYANKAIEILNAWSPVLWHFDYNDAKLLAAWTGHALCNAAEILRYTGAGWQPADIDRFKEMLMTVYYPLMRFYYPQANGNWDGAIEHSILAIAIFTDNRTMFNNAVDHYLRGPVNGGILKYVFPSGQCQESMRDQGHVQLGLGEFAGAAQVAYTQGVDLFAAGDNRLALGYEYTAGFLLGQNPHCYGGPISPRAKELRDDYEAVYQHYTSIGVDMPNAKQAIDALRPKASRSVLVALRAPSGKAITKKGAPKVSDIAYIAGATAAVKTAIAGNVVEVAPGQSLQQALDNAAGKNGVVLAKAGVHTLPAPLKMPSGVTLAGEGIKTILFLNPGDNRETIVNGADDMHDVTIRDLLIEGNTKTELPSDPNSSRSYRGGYNRGGILFRCNKAGNMKNISLENLTVQNCTYSGVFISGAADVTIARCDLNENGASVPPGFHLLHNLLLTHCSAVKVTDCRLVTSPLGSGIAVEECNDVLIGTCEVARNGYYGIDIVESSKVLVTGNLVEANDRSGIMVEFQYKGCSNITVTKNRIQYNTGYGIESYAVKNGATTLNTLAGNGNKTEQQKVSLEKTIVME